MSDSHLAYDDPQDPIEMIQDCQAAGVTVATARRDLTTHHHDAAMAGAAAVTSSLHLD